MYIPDVKSASLPGLHALLYCTHCTHQELKKDQIYPIGSHDVHVGFHQ